MSFSFVLIKYLCFFYKNIQIKYLLDHIMLFDLGTKSNIKTKLEYQNWDKKI